LLQHLLTRLLKLKHRKVFHFSWTYLLTKGQFLIFQNKNNLKNKNPVVLIREALTSLGSTSSGIRVYAQMMTIWKPLTEKAKGIQHFYVVCINWL
jgi:hypothetical protein